MARVISARRGLLLAAHRRRLSREELEDCYSQATFELLVRAQRGRPFFSHEHIANAFEQRLLARIYDRRRAVGGRSPMETAIAQALPLADRERPERAYRGQLVDERADVQQIVQRREDLRRIVSRSRELTRDQRLLLAGQLAGVWTPAEFCALHGWTPEKYRKVGQRARARLRRLLLADSLVPVASERSEQQVGNRS